MVISIYFRHNQFRNNTFYARIKMHKKLVLILWVDEQGIGCNIMTGCTKKLLVRWMDALEIGYNIMNECIRN